MDYYKRNGKEALFDFIRNQLVVKTPEEIVRQKILSKLVNTWKVPKTCIEVEVPLINFDKHSRKRADILISHYKSDDTCTPLMVIECKNNNQPILDDAIEQVKSYAEILKCKYLCVINEHEYIVFDYKNKKYHQLKSFPTYSEMLKSQNLLYKNDEAIYPFTYSDCLSTKTSKEFLELGIIGEDTDIALHPKIINLYNAIYNMPHNKDEYPCQYNDIQILKRLDDKFTSFGSNSPGKMTGQFSSYLLQDSKGYNQIYRIGILATGHFENDKYFGNRKGYTYLMVTIDDFDLGAHCSLYLMLDKYMIQEGDNTSLEHDGAITVGNLGAVKKDIFIQYVNKNYPNTFIDGKISFGSFMSNKLINYQDIKYLLYRCMKYAEIRDDFRMEYKGKKR